MELCENKHEPPSPNSLPRRSSLKGSASFTIPKMDVLESPSGDDVSDIQASEPSSNDTAHARFVGRRASWGDEVGKELLTVHHGAPALRPQAFNSLEQVGRVGRVASGPCGDGSVWRLGGVAIGRCGD